MPDNRRRRRAYYQSPIIGADGSSHPFLTEKGLRLQREQARVADASPRSLPVFPDTQYAQPASPPSDLYSLQNILPSKKFPDVRVLDRTPLSNFCESKLVPTGSSPQLKAIGKLFIQLAHLPQGERAAGSAWITGPSTIATSAHNLYDFTKSMWSQSVEFFPSHNHYGKERFPSCRVTACTIPKGYFENPTTNNDIAICHVDRNIGDIVGERIAMRPVYDNGVFESNKIAVVGYPAGSSFDFGKQLWASTGDYLFGRRNGPDDDFSPVIASTFGGGCSGCPWLIADENGKLSAIGASSGHSRLKQLPGEPNMMSLVSPFFGPRMFNALQQDATFHQFDIG